VHARVQVALRWIVQSGATFSTSATSEEDFAEDIDVFDFVLTDDEMATLNSK